ncbi:hypothetical protein HOH87_08630 [bacterium]|jgi:hypothetical protein|nr:hypothetical protein [bacterium]
MSLEEDQKLVEEMKALIHETSLGVSEKVTRSAVGYMLKKGWVQSADAEEVEAFICKKIPKVLAEEHSRLLYERLGLNNEIAEDE